MMLTHLLGTADRIAVIDTETTGVYPSDRVLEVAIVTLTGDGEVVDRWETLLQPDRDVGPTHVHRITPAMLVHAPRFVDVAGDIADRLDGAVLAGHNVAFDRRQLAAEFDRAGLGLVTPDGVVCTLRCSGAKLGAACHQHGVELQGAHRARADAEATVQLLLRLADRATPAGPARITGPRPPHLQRVLTRDAVDRPLSWPTPPLIVSLADQLRHDDVAPDLLPYLDVLDRAVSDLHLDREERVELAELATELGLGHQHVAAAHRRFVNDLIDAALDDHIVTDEEYDTLLRVATALDVDHSVVDARTTAARASATQLRLEPGLRVVFTGNVEGWTRTQLEEQATAWGLDPARNVTKGTALVAAADPASRSGKAKKAHGWGIPVVDVADLLAAGPTGTISTAATVERLRVIECPDCHVTTTEPAATGGTLQRRCQDCS